MEHSWANAGLVHLCHISWLRCLVVRTSKNVLKSTPGRNSHESARSSGLRGSEKAWGCAIPLIPRGLRALRWWCWTCFLQKMSCCMGPIKSAPAHPNLLLISHHLLRQSLQFIHQGHHALSSEIWAETSSDLHRLQNNDWALMHWMCGVTTKDQVSSQDHLGRMHFD